MSETAARDHFASAIQRYQNVLGAGAEIHQECAAWFRQMLDGLGSPEQWRQRSLAVMDEAVAAGGKNVDETIRAMNDNARAALELLEKVTSSPSDDGDNENWANVDELWASGLATLRTNIETVVTANTRVVDSWFKVLRLMNGEIDGLKENRSGGTPAHLP